MASGNVSFRCTKKKCSARIEMDKSITYDCNSTIVRVNSYLMVSINDIVNDHDAQCHILCNNCKRKANENITDRPSKIMRHELCPAENTEMISVVSDDIGNNRVSMYRQKRKLLTTSDNASIIGRSY